MKKRILTVLLTAVLLMSMGNVCYADKIQGKDGWAVTFSSAGKMVSNFKSGEIAEEIAGMQPSDELTMTITVKNEHAEDTDWYIKNEIKKSLEDKSSASGGAYSYVLTYKGPDGSVKELFNSDTVGGEKESSKTGEGLHEVDNAMKDDFYLGTLKSGQSGIVTLTITLDGESQGNRYQGTDANLQLQFAVELQNPDTVVVTGDSNDIYLYSLAMFIGGALLFLLGILQYKVRRGGAES